MSDMTDEERARALVQEKWGRYQHAKPTFDDWLRLQALIVAELRAVRAPLEQEVARLREERAAYILVIHFDKRSVHKVGEPCPSGVCP